MSGVSGAGGQTAAEQAKQSQELMGGTTGAMEGISKTGKQDELLGQANEQTAAQSESVNDMNASSQEQSQGVNPANRADSGEDQSKEAYGASTDAATDAANQGL